MAFACISIGSNLDQPSQQVEEAIRLLAVMPDSNLLKRSRLYQTKPWGVKNQPDFINAIAGLNTELQPVELLDELQKIETAQGRIRHEKWGARILDLDIICYDQLNMDTPRLKLPHPYFSQRAFVLEPLVELYPDLLIAGNSVQYWLKNLSENHTSKDSTSKSAK